MIVLNPIKTWVEKNKFYPDGALRIYCGTELIGMALPSPERGDLFQFISDYESVIRSLRKFNKTEQQVIDHCELCLKEFIDKVCKRKSNLIPVIK